MVTNEVMLHELCMFDEIMDIQLNFFLLLQVCRNNGTYVFSKRMVMHWAYDTNIRSVWLVGKFCHLLA